jgi:hypothetical protein
MAGASAPARVARVACISNKKAGPGRGRLSATKLVHFMSCWGVAAAAAGAGQVVISCLQAAGLVGL